MRILLSAFACSPDRGSEPGVGWNWASRLSREHEVHVLCADWFKDNIDAVLTTGTQPRLYVHYVPTRTSEERAQYRRFRGWLLYYEWQWRAYKLASKLHEQYRFDLAHHVTLASWRVPSFLYKLPIPFIWGPLGGGQMSPRGFLSLYGTKGMMMEVARTAMQYVSACDPFVHRAIKNSTYILGANSDTVRFLGRYRGHRIDHMCETAYDPVTVSRSYDSPERRAAPRPNRCRLLWVGGLEPRKALPLLLHALARMPDRGYELVVIGHGKEESRLRQLTTQLGLDEVVFFRGALPYREVQSAYGYADIFVFTSLRETSGNVLFEAMGAGLPIVCLNWSGPGDLTDDWCSIRIEPNSPEQVISDLAKALQQLARDPALRASLGRAGQERALRCYGWRTKIDSTVKLYNELVSADRS